MHYLQDVEIPCDGRILYFDRDRARFSFLSHFHPAPIVCDGEAWATVEHYYQAQKSRDPDYRRAVREAATPGLAKRMAARSELPRRALRGSWFRASGKIPRADWHEVRLDVMRHADRRRPDPDHPHRPLLRTAHANQGRMDQSQDDFERVAADQIAALKYRSVRYRCESLSLQGPFEDARIRVRTLGAALVRGCRMRHDCVYNATAMHCSLGSGRASVGYMPPCG